MLEINFILKNKHQNTVFIFINIYIVRNYLFYVFKRAIYLLKSLQSFIFLCHVLYWLNYQLDLDPRLESAGLFL